MFQWSIVTEEGGPFGLACLINNGGVYTAKYEHRPRQLCTPPPTPDLNEDNDICYGFHTLPMRYSIFNHAAAWQGLVCVRVGYRSTQCDNPPSRSLLILQSCRAPALRRRTRLYPPGTRPCAHMIPVADIRPHTHLRAETSCWRSSRRATSSAKPSPAMHGMAPNSRRSPRWSSSPTAHLCCRRQAVLGGPERTRLTRGAGRRVAFSVWPQRARRRRGCRRAPAKRQRKGYWRAAPRRIAMCLERVPCSTRTHRHRGRGSTGPSRPGAPPHNASRRGLAGSRLPSLSSDRPARSALPGKSPLHSARTALSPASLCMAKPNPRYSQPIT